MGKKGKGREGRERERGGVSKKKMKSEVERRNFFFCSLDLFVALYHFTHKPRRFKHNIRLTGRIAGCLIRTGLKKSGKRGEEKEK